MTTVTQNAWGIVFCGGRKTRLFSQTYRTRMEARADFVTWWHDTKEAERQLKIRRYRIIKVRIEGQL